MLHFFYTPQVPQNAATTYNRKAQNSGPFNYGNTWGANQWQQPAGGGWWQNWREGDGA